MTPAAVVSSVVASAISQDYEDEPPLHPTEL
jgi:hypothetical protein